MNEEYEQNQNNEGMTIEERLRYYTRQIEQIPPINWGLDALRENIHRQFNQEIEPMEGTVGGRMPIEFNNSVDWSSVEPSVWAFDPVTGGAINLTELRRKREETERVSRRLLEQVFGSEEETE